MRRYFLLLVLAILAVCCKSDDTVIPGSIKPLPGDTRTVVGNANADDPTENNLKAAIAKIYGDNFANESGLSIVVEGTMNQADFASLRTFEVVDLTNVNVVGLIDVVRASYENGVVDESTLEQVNGNAIPANIFSGENNFGIIEQITLPATVTVVGEGAFKGCSNMAVIEAANIKTIKAGAFEGCEDLNTISGVVKEANAPAIGAKAFYNAGIQNLVIPATVESIGEGAFSSEDETMYATIELEGDGYLLEDGTYRLPSVVAGAFPESYTRNVGDKYIQLTGGQSTTKSFIPYEYRGWTSYNLQCGNSTTDAVTVELAAGETLTTAIATLGKLPYSLTVKGAMTVNDAVNDFAALKGIATVDLSGATITDGTTESPFVEVPEAAFAVETQMSSVVSSLSTLTTATKANAVPSPTDVEGENLISITLPATVTKIGKDAFKNCANLLQVNFDGDAVVAEFGVEAFSGCNMLLQNSFDTLTKGAVTMEDGAFMGCNSLKYINLPTTLVTLGDNLFSGCAKLEKITADWYGEGVDAQLPVVKPSVFPAAYARSDKYSEDSKYIEVPGYKKYSYQPKDGSENNGWELMGIDDGTYIGAGYEYTTPVLEIGGLDAALKYLFGDEYATGEPIEKVRIQGVVQALDIKTYLTNFKEIIFVSNDLEGNVINHEADGGRELVAVSIVNGGATQTTANALVTKTWGGDDTNDGNFIIERVELPEGLTATAGDTFYKCKNLKSVGMPSTVVKPSWREFGTCTLLEEVYATGAPETQWSEYIEVFGQNLFTEAGAIKEFKLGPNLATMVKTSIRKCPMLEKITFAETASPISIADLAISECPNLKTIEMPWTSTSTMPTVGAQTSFPAQFFAVSPGATSYFTLPADEDGKILEAYKVKKLDTGKTWGESFNLTQAEAENNETQEGYLEIEYNMDATATEPTLSAVIAQAVTDSKKFWDKVKVKGNLVMTVAFDDIDDLDAIIDFKEADLSEAIFILDGVESMTIPSAAFNTVKRPTSLQAKFKVEKIIFGDITSVQGSCFQFYSNLKEIWFGENARFSLPSYTFNGTSLTNESFNAMLTHVTAFTAGLSFNDAVVTELVIPSTNTLTSGTIPKNVFGSGAAGLKAATSVKFNEAIKNINQVPTLGEKALPAQFYEDYKPTGAMIAQQSVNLDGETRFTEAMLRAVAGWEGVNFTGKAEYVAPDPKVTLGNSEPVDFKKGNLAAELDELLDGAAKSSIVMSGGIAVEDLAALSGFESIDITGVTFDDGVVDPFAAMTFEGDAALKSINLPAMEKLNDNLFFGCTSLERVAVGGSASIEVGANAFADTKMSTDNLISLLSRVSKMGERAFANISTLTDVALSTDLTAISTEAFAGCSAVEAINIPTGVKSIAAKAFMGCDKVEKITLNWSSADDFATVVGAGAEQSLPEAFNAGGSKYITIANTAAAAKELAGWDTYYMLTVNEVAENDPTLVVVTEVGTLEAAIIKKFGADYADTVHEKIKVVGPLNGVYSAYTGTAPEGILTDDFDVLQNFKVVDLESATVSYQLVNTQTGVLTTTANVVANTAFINNLNVTEIVFPSTATKIGGQACMGCKNLTKVTMPTGLYVVDWSAFGSCANLQDLTQAEIERITAMGAGAFSGCAKFTKFTVGSSITAINQNILDDCTSLVEFTITNKKVATIQTAAFDGCGALAKINLPYMNATELPTIVDKSPVANKGTYSDLFPVQFMRGESASRYLSFPEGADIESIKGTVIAGNITWGSLFCFSEDDIRESGGTVISGGTVSINGAAAVNFEAEQLGATLNALGDSFKRTSIVITGSVIGTDWVEIKRFAEVDLTEASFGAVLPVKAFSESTDLVSVKLPELKTIGSGSFAGCSVLESVTIAGGVDDTFTVGSTAFQNCLVLAEADIQAIIGRATDFGSYTTFTNCAMLTEVTNIRPEVTIIPPTSFQNCKNLVKFVVPATVTALGSVENSAVFTGCTSLTDVIFEHMSEVAISKIVGATNTANATVFDAAFMKSAPDADKRYIKIQAYLDPAKIKSNGWENYNFDVE